MVAVRVEFIKVKKSNNELSTAVDNVISGRSDPSQDVTVTSTVTVAASRPSVPSTCDAVRLTAVGGNIYAEWGVDPTATATSGIRLVADQPEVIAMKRNDKMSFLLAT